MENGDKPSDIEYGYAPETIIDSTLILLIIVMIMISIYIYTRRHLVLFRHHHQNHRRPHFVFYIAPELAEPPHGLEPSVIASLPIFTFSANSNPIECAVCLSEFENGESGRVLPNCKHCFHIECIDMWFMSHSTCPLCRVHVDCPPVQPEVVVNVSQLEPGSSSGEVNRVHDSAASSLQMTSIKRGGLVS